VYDVLEYLAGGMTEDAILSDFPDLTREDIRAVLASLTLISSVLDNADNGSLLTGWCGNRSMRLLLSLVDPRMYRRLSLGAGR
jgi:hypothetical protein